MATLTIGERRRRLGITQEQLADKARVSVGMVRVLEAGYKPMRGKTLAKISEQLDLLERERND